jgi:integrase
MALLADVPPEWVSRRKAERHTPGWAPFRGPLTLASQGRALAALHSLFAWLVQARHLASNPWVLVNRKLGDDPDHHGIDDAASRAFTPAAWAAIGKYLDVTRPSPSLERLRWICAFVEATGLHAAELLRAELGHLQKMSAGWVLRVHGKGRRNRTVPVPSQALRATHEYLAKRGLAVYTPPATPLLASLAHADLPITYGALHQTFTRFVRKAVRALPAAERGRAEIASAHWLRHTHATRAAERAVPPDVPHENLGQSDPRTTARYYRAQIERRQQAMEGAFGDAAGSEP